MIEKYFAKEEVLSKHVIEADCVELIEGLTNDDFKAKFGI